MSVDEHPMEVIEWGENQQNATTDPESKYGFITESLRHNFPEAKTCSMFCGGKKCKYCNPEASPIWTKNQKVIDGLYSNCLVITDVPALSRRTSHPRVTENILAMSRPSSILIAKYHIIEQFEKCGIRSVINLQRPGEHATCGPDVLKPGGFSYDPEEFMKKDVFYYNFGWQDYNVGSLTSILDMVKVMQFALSEGKVAIHCHAGLGRTGVLIASYLIFANRISANEAINYVRLKRESSIQTRSQLDCIKQFADWLKPFRVIYASMAEGMYSFTLPHYLERQKCFLHGYEARKLKDTPKIVAVCCSRLLKLAGKDASLLEKCNLMKEQIILPGLSKPHLSSTHSSPIQEKKEIPDLRFCNTFDSFTPHMRDHHIRLSCSQNLLSDFCSSSSGGSLQLSSVQSDGGLNERGTAGTETIDEETEKIALAMAEMNYSAKLMEKVKTYKTRLNEENGSWNKLSQEEEPLVLSALLWEWIDHLKEPILHAQDLPLMLEYIEEPRTGLGQLDKGAQATVIYLVATVALLWPVSKATHIALLQRLISTLTHQNMVLEPHLMLSVQPRLTVSTTAVMRENVAHKLLVFFRRLIMWFCEVANHDAKKSKEHGSEGDSAREEGSTNRGKHRGKGKVSRWECDFNGVEERKRSEGRGEMAPSDDEERS